MPRIQQSIEVKLPVHTVYNQLIRFEEYPRFMQDVEQVQQIDDSHLHWTTRISNRPVEWDAAIVEQVPDRCIAWHNISGPTNAGRVEVQQADTQTQTARVIMTLEAEPEQVPGSASGDTEAEMARRLKLDLARFKDFIEAGGTETKVHDGRAETGGSGPAARTSSRSASSTSPRTAAELRNHSAGSVAAQQPAEFGVPPQRKAAALRNDSAGSARPSVQQSGQSAKPAAPQVTGSTQSDYSLSDPEGNEKGTGPFSVAEEVNFDEQSARARHVGQMPQDTAVGMDTAGVSDAIGKAMQDRGQDERGSKGGSKRDSRDEEKLKQSIERAVPPER